MGWKWKSFPFDGLLLLLPDARRIGRKKYHLKWSYWKGGKSKPYFMILFRHSAPALLLHLSSISWLFSDTGYILILGLWPTNGVEYYLVYLLMVWLCLSMKEPISLLWWRLALQSVAQWLFCSLWSSGMKYSESGSSILGRGWTCNWSIVSHQLWLFSCLLPTAVELGFWEGEVGLFVGLFVIMLH